MHWLAIHCTDLPLEVFPGIPADAPAAATERHGGREWLSACNAVARHHGLYPGMALSAARVRVPELRACLRNPEAERGVLARLAAACLHFTDHVALEPPAGVLLEVGRSRRLFGGLDTIAKGVRDLLAGLGSRAAIGMAPTPAAARLLARNGGGRIDAAGRLERELAPLPWSALDPGDEVAARLAGWGLRTLGECFALPRDGLARRLGPGFVDTLDRLRGCREEVPGRFTAPARFSGRLPLPAESTTLELPLAGLERLLAELEYWLRSRDAGIQRLVVELQPPRGAATDIHVELAVPGRQAAHLLAVVRERLERAELPERVVAVGLRAQRPVAYVPPPADFWHAPEVEPAERLLERLRARLGREAVRGLGLHADYRPERAWTWSAPGAVSAHEPRDPPPRPLWLLAEPVALRQDARGRPCCEGTLELIDGPERIETGWWDGDDVERDYFVGRNPAGMTLWLYRERRVPCAWYVHGLFG